MDVLAWLAIPLLPQLLSPVGIGLLFGGFGLLLATGLLLVLWRSVKTVRDYFSASRRMQRKLWFSAQKQQEMAGLFQLKTAKIDYLARLKRHRLQSKNDRKHLRLLSKAIGRELSTIQSRVPKSQLKQLQDDFKQYKNNQDIAALLKLQQHIASLH